jgi:ribonuclease-3
MAEALESAAVLEERIGYQFTDKDLLCRALTHPSYGQENRNSEHNQRLEFLGDAVLGLVLAEMLFEELPKEREGALTRFRSMLVKGHQLCQLGRELELGNYLRLGDAEEAQGGRDRDSILEDAFEAVIGAVYLDGGLEVTRRAAQGIYGPLEARLDKQTEGHNPKGRLQELLQPRLGNESIEYRLIEESGPDHQKHFTVEVWIQDKRTGEGSGPSKKLAEAAAALDALEGMTGEA